MIENRNYLYIVLSERILLFSLLDYSRDMTVEILDLLYDCNLLKEKKLSGRPKIINSLLHDKISNMYQEVSDFAKGKNLKLYFFDSCSDLSEFSEFLEDRENFVNRVKRIFKSVAGKRKILDIMVKDSIGTSGKFDDIPCLNLSGEQIEKIFRKTA